jgi:hypothetical protein
MGRYFLNLLIALDQTGNAIFGGYPDETISLRAARARDKGERWGCVLCKLLELIVPNHCTNTERSKHSSIIARNL